jgi:hypothetical protein
MRARLGRWSKKLAAQSVPPVVPVIATAVAIAASTRFLIRGFGFPTSVGQHILYDVAIVVVGALIWCLVAAIAWWAHGRVGQARRCVVEHRGTVATVCLVLVAVAAVITLLFVAATAWRGGSPGTVAEVVGRILLAVVLGGGTVLITLWPYVIGPRASRGPRVAGAVAAGWLAVGAFLLAIHHFPPGSVLVGVYLVAQYAWIRTADKREMRGEPDFYRGLVAGAYLVIGAGFWARIIPVGTVAKWAGETALAALVGTVTALLIWRGVRDARPIPRRLGTVAIVLVPAYLLFLLFDDQLLGGLLDVPVFPLAGWLAFRLWRHMRTSTRVTVKAAGDIVFALTAGSVLVLFLAWLANVLALAPAEVEVIKRVAAAVRYAVELPPWVWACGYVALTGGYLLAALGPSRFQSIPRRLGALHVVPGLDAVRRTFTMTGVGLMALAFLGLVVPPAASTLLGNEIRQRYTIAAQEELEASDRIAVYQAIASQLRGSPVRLTVLAELVEDVHRAEPPATGADTPAPAELNLAHRLGQLQARTLVGPFNRPQANPQAAVTEVELDRPIRNVDDLDDRLTRQQQADDLTTTRRKQAETAAELAAATVTSLLDTVHLGNSEVVGVVREYLDGLAESPLGEVFLAWTQRLLPGRPPSAPLVVEPDPERLNNAARTQLFVERVTEGGPAVPDLSPSPKGMAALVHSIVTAENTTIGIEREHLECPDCGRPGEPPIEEHGPVG